MDKPQNASDAPAPSALPLFVALGTGVVAAMLVAVLVPSGDEGTNWLLALGVAVVAAVVAYVVVGRRGRATTRRPGEH